MAWQNLLIQGKEKYNESDWLQAEFLTKQAEILLDDSLSDNGVEQSTLLAWICANHNLSAIYEQQGDIRVALQYLIEPHRYALSLSNSAQSADLMVLALNSLNITLKRITLFRKKHTICNECYKALANYKSFITKIRSGNETTNSLIH